jgi:hypothetical protein
MYINGAKNNEVHQLLGAAALFWPIAATNCRAWQRRRAESAQRKDLKECAMHNHSAQRINEVTLCCRASADADRLRAACAPASGRFHQLPARVIRHDRNRAGRMRSASKLCRQPLDNSQAKKSPPKRAR